MKLKFTFNHDELEDFLKFLKNISDCQQNVYCILISIVPEEEYKVLYVMYSQDSGRDQKILMEPIYYLHSYKIHEKNVLIEKSKENAQKDKVTMCIEIKKLKKFVNSVQHAFESILLSEQEFTIKYANVGQTKSLVFSYSGAYSCHVECICYSSTFKAPQVIDTEDFVLKGNIGLDKLKIMLNTVFKEVDDDSMILSKFTGIQLNEETYLDRFSLRSGKCFVKYQFGARLERNEKYNIDNGIVTFRYGLFQKVIGFRSKIDVDDCQLILKQESLCFVFTKYFIDENGDQDTLFTCSLEFPVEIGIDEDEESQNDSLLLNYINII
jgi:hypothetical protein